MDNIPTYFLQKLVGEDWYTHCSSIHRSVVENLRDDLLKKQPQYKLQIIERTIEVHDILRWTNA